VVVLVHGSLDRAASFNRVARRLGEWAVVTYDRRGYQSSRPAGVATALGDHVDDLLAVAAVYGALGPLSAVGHSVGGSVVLAAAVAAPERFCSVGAYEPSLPWLASSGYREVPVIEEADAEVERFYRRVVGDAAWERLGEPARRDRLADGPALVADLAAVRSGVPFDVARLGVPAVIGTGGPASFPHHIETAQRLGVEVPAVRRATITEAGHGAHLSHPDAFAAFVRAVVALAGVGT
jgi:pimeloyl-ACP methyl ester carboxylesterase